MPVPVPVPVSVSVPGSEIAIGIAIECAPTHRAEISDFGFQIFHWPQPDTRYSIRSPIPFCPQMTQITQIKTRTYCDVICARKFECISKEIVQKGTDLSFGCILHPASCILHPASSIEHRASSFEGQLSEGGEAAGASAGTNAPSVTQCS